MSPQIDSQCKPILDEHRSMQISGDSKVARSPNEYGTYDRSRPMPGNPYLGDV